MVVRRKVHDKHEELRQRKEKSLLGGASSASRHQHERGKLTARERIALLLDEGTFEELDPFALPYSADKEPYDKKLSGMRSSLATER